MSETKELNVKQALEKFSSSEKGLSEDAYRKNLDTYGYNEISEKKVSAIVKFLQYLWGPIPWMIEAAVILSAGVGDWTDFYIILLLLVTNALVGYFEEHQADNAVEALKKKLAPEARVLRNTKWSVKPARELVPGDIIRLRMGDIVPSDAVIWQGKNVQVDQSALTGESMPVEKSEPEQIFSGSIIKKGETNAVVVATGADTYFGKTTTLMEEAHTVSHFQKAVLKIGNYLIAIALFLVVVILIVSVFRGDVFLTILRFCLVLTIAAIPVAMPTVLSVTMVIGAKALSKKNAVVRKLSSVEEIAGIDVLCSDKTGTLTQNKLTTGTVFTSGNINADEVIEKAALASREEDEDPIDIAVLEAVKNKKRLNSFTVEDFTPFDPVHKRTESLVKDSKGREFRVSKGAPQVILSLVPDKESIHESINGKINEFAGKGYRTIGVAQTNAQNNWEFLGLIPLYDPPREDSKETIREAKELGVEVKMVTGDQEAIARETAKELDIGRNILNVSVFEDTKHHEQAKLAEQIEKANGFAEVYPEHKYHIVDVLQHKDHFVGMTGDGVNDAPALKKADAGIAVSGATNAARAAASIVLLEPGLSVIIDAIRESRKIFLRMKSYTIYRITETIDILLFMTLSILTFNVYPVTAIMIIFLTLLNDGAIISIAYDHTKVAKTPQKWDMHLILILSTSLGIMSVIESFGIFYAGRNFIHVPKEMLQTLIYLKLSVGGHLTVFVARTRRHFWSHKPSLTLFLAVLITQTIATLISVYGFAMAPIGWRFAAIVWIYCIVWFFILDFTKLVVYKMFEEGNSLFFISKRGKHSKSNQ